MGVRTVLLILSAAALAAPAAAAAKEIEKVQVCGASKCFTFDRGNSGGKLMRFEQGGPTAPPPARPAPWYRLKITVGGRDVRRFQFTNAYVPSAGLVRVRAEGGGYEWVEVLDDLRPVLRNVAAGLDPLPASTLRGVDRSHARPRPARSSPEGQQAAVASDPGLPVPLLIAVAVGVGSALMLLARRLGWRRG